MTPTPLRALHPEALIAEIQAFPWQRRVWRVDLHHTFDPDHARWRTLGSARTLTAMQARDIADFGGDGQRAHATVMPDGLVWLGRDWNETPASVGTGLDRGVFMIDAVGNFDLGHDRLEGAQLASVVRVIRSVQSRFGLPVEALLFHREVPLTDKSCPGTGVRKREMLAMLRRAQAAELPTLVGMAGLPVDVEAA